MARLFRRDAAESPSGGDIAAAVATLAQGILVAPDHSAGSRSRIEADERALFFGAGAISVRGP